ncbi:MAG: hypothetical protein EBU90_04770 [Proteobacteria bacterium]|nr:hypothetical protein [Pseudomonadota bacterium]NBP13769.1 hypothetical protein [bacterium]
METNNSNFIDPVVVSKYLFVRNYTPTHNTKRIKRRLHKRNIGHLVTEQKYHDLLKQGTELLFDFLVQLKKNTRFPTKMPAVGFLSDHNTVTEDIHIIPPPPVAYDILCLQSDINEYIWEDTVNNMYWCRTKINDSQHFVINTQSIERVLPMLKASKTWSDFMTKANEHLKIYTITQYMLSQPTDAESNPIKPRNLLPDKALISMFDQSFQNLTAEQRYTSLPAVSLVCVLTDTEQFFHTLYCFLKLEYSNVCGYPRDKLELIMVDDIDAEKRLKGSLPNDSRIKIVNLSGQKATNEIPLGYKYNMGVKYASHELIYHFADTQHYYIHKFTDLIKCLVMSGKDCIVSVDSAFWTPSSSTVDKSLCLDNMLYTKNFWKVSSFENKQTQPNVLVNKYIRHRSDTVGFLPFLYFSFKYIETSPHTTRLPFDLITTVNNTLQESFKEVTHTNRIGSEITKSL